MGIKTKEERKAERKESKLLKLLIRLFERLLPFLIRKIKSVWFWLVVVILAVLGSVFGFIDDATLDKIIENFSNLLG